MTFKIDDLVRLLQKRADSPEVSELLGSESRAIERTEHIGFVDFKDRGISMMFKEAPWVIPQREVEDPRALYVCAFHLYRRGYEGYSEYEERLPGEVSFGDSQSILIGKLGEPLARGGGGFSAILKRKVPNWLQYDFYGKMLNFQLDDQGQVELITLYTPDLQQSR